MLVLTRKVGDTIRIGPDIRVTIVGVQGQRVQLGVEAPRDLTVDRPERRQGDDETPVKKS